MKTKRSYWIIALIALLLVAVVVYTQGTTIAPPTTTVPTTVPTTAPTTVATTVATTTVVVLNATCSDVCTSGNYTSGRCRIACYSWETNLTATCDVEGQKCCCKT